MDSTVKLRPNHYELLGLTPSATGEEIAQAFAKELGLLRPRAFGSLAEVTVAYETLRDPIKRKAYDQSIGIKADVEPQPRPALSLAGRLEGAALGTPPPKPVVQLKSPPPPPPGASARPRPEPRPQARMGPPPPHCCASRSAWIFPNAIRPPSRGRRARFRRNQSAALNRTRPATACLHRPRWKKRIATKPSGSSRLWRPAR